ncbi:capsular polysaccharide transport system permease protein [Pararhizobium capsulatum DSM 1112]|uniref:Capsular polysaccharide transport system permease protein n=1 Tax=Pararhizobium capsulatum DSM 1112 TaxID=1121113 RepID=A0ABU0BML6_9HYPH|nr:capsular polysaccharide transport system permease protein [Pararhizobium capsulatum DSM 1112]
MTHLRVVGALLIREMEARFGSKPGGYVWALLDPAAHIVLMTVLFQAIARAPALGTSFPLFFATGYLGFQFYQAMVGYINGAVKSNRTLLSYPNVAPFDTISARFLLQFMTTSLVACIVLGVIIGWIRVSPNLHWPPILQAATVAAVLDLGVGLINNVMFLKYPLYEQIFAIFNRPMFLVSGVFFLPDAIPLPYRDIVLLNPLIHVTMMFRTGFYDGYRAAGLDPGYLYNFAFLTLFLGMLLFTFSSTLLRNE